MGRKIPEGILFGLSFAAIDMEIEFLLSRALPLRKNKMKRSRLDQRIDRAAAP